MSDWAHYHKVTVVSSTVIEDTFLPSSQWNYKTVCSNGIIIHTMWQYAPGTPLRIMSNDTQNWKIEQVRSNTNG